MTTILRSPKKVEIFYLVWDFVVIYHNWGFPMMQLEKIFNYEYIFRATSTRRDLCT